MRLGRGFGFWIRRVVQVCLRRRRFVLSLALLLGLAGGMAIPGIELRLDARSLVASSRGDLEESDAAAKRMGHRDVVSLVVVNERSGVLSLRSLREIERLSHLLGRCHGILEPTIVSIAMVPVLSTCGGVMDVRAAGSGTEAWGPEDAAKARGLLNDLGLHDNILLAADGRAAGLYASVDPTADRERLLEDIRSSVGAAPGDVRFGGTALAQAVLGRAAVRDLARIVPLCILVVLVLLAVAFRHPFPPLVALAEIGLTLLVTGGIMGLRHQPVFVTTLTLPVILLVVGMSDDVYALDRIVVRLRKPDRPSVEQAIEEALASIAKPVFVAAGTTAVGLFSLVFTGLAPLRTFGLFGSVAVLMSTVFTFTLVPALLATFSSSLRRASAPGLQFEERWRQQFKRIRWWSRPRDVKALAVCVAIGSAVLATRLRANDSWVTNLPSDSDVVAGDRALNEYLAGSTTVEFAVGGDKSGDFTHANQVARLDALADEAHGIHGVGAVHSFAIDVVRTIAALRGVSVVELRHKLASGDERFTDAYINQALVLLETAPRSRLHRWLDRDQRTARLTVFVRDADVRAIARVVEGVKQEAASLGMSVVPYGDAWISVIAVRKLVVGQVVSIALALLADFVLLALFLRSTRVAVVACVPVALSVLIVFGVMALLGIPLGVATSMFAAIGLGIGVDFSIHLAIRIDAMLTQGLDPVLAIERALTSTGPAILAGAASLSCGMAVLLLSNVAPNRSLGLLVAISLLVSAMATLSLAPSLALAQRPAR